MNNHHGQPRANKTDAGNGSKAICRVSNVLRSPSPDPGRSPNKQSPPLPTMRAISVQQPWPYAIFHEGKDVENRDFKPTIELPADIAIQVSKNIDKKPKLPRGFKHLADLPEAYSPEERGCVIGVVTLDEIVEDDNSIWRQGARYGWRLSNPRLLTKPVEMSGNQTTKEVPPDVLRKIKSRLKP